MEANRLNSVKEVAHYLNVSTKTIHRKVKDKAIPFLLIGCHPKFDKKKIDQWLEKRQVKELY